MKTQGAYTTSFAFWFLLIFYPKKSHNYCAYNLYKLCSTYMQNVIKKKQLSVKKHILVTI